MDPYWLARTLEDHPAVRVLRAQNAPIILGFLHGAFKQRQLITVSNQDLVLQLGAFLEERGHDETREGDPIDRAASLIEGWCGEQSRYLRKYLDDRGAAQHELTPALETVFRWLDDLKPREFVGTESQFQDLLRRLRELVENSGEDPARALAQLTERRAGIDREILRIEQTGTVDTYTPVQIRERLQELSRSARDLLSDFRQVEQNFRDVVREIHREQSQGDRDRGGLLGLTLDLVDELHASPQGQSFDAFWRFLVVDSGQDEINTLVETLFRRLAERDLALPDPLLRRLKIHLHQAGGRVVETNRILAEKLNRILAERVRRELEKTRELIGAIRGLALAAVDNPPTMDDFLTLETDPHVSMIMDRPLSTAQRQTRFYTPEDSRVELEQADIAALFSQMAVDERRLRSCVNSLLDDRSQVSLPEVLARYPVEEGLAEIVTYLSLATVLNDAERDMVRYRHGERTVSVTVPRAVYTR